MDRITSYNVCYTKLLREPERRPPRGEQQGLHRRGRAEGRPERGEVPVQHPGRIQHRRRRVRDRAHRGEVRHDAALDVLGELDVRRVHQRPHGRPERGHVPPFHQLPRGDDGKEVRHSVVQGKLRRRRGLRQVAHKDRRVLRGQGPDRADQEGGRGRASRGREGSFRDQGAVRRQEGHAFRRRLPGPPLPGTLLV